MLLFLPLHRIITLLQLPKAEVIPRRRQSQTFIYPPSSPSRPHTMPRLGDDGQEEETLLEYGTKRTRRIVGGFLDFATQGNILEIAFGLM